MATVTTIGPHDPGDTYTTRMLPGFELVVAPRA